MPEIKTCCICSDDILDDWAYDIKKVLDTPTFTVIDEYVCNRCGDKSKGLIIKVLVKKITKGVFKIKIGNRKWKFLKKLNA